MKAAIVRLQLFLFDEVVVLVLLKERNICDEVD